MIAVLGRRRQLQATEMRPIRSNLCSNPDGFGRFIDDLCYRRVENVDRHKREREKAEI